MPARELKSSSKLIKLKYWEKFKKEVMASIWEQWYITSGKREIESNLKEYTYNMLT